MAGNNSHNTRLHVEATERQQQCLDMRCRGMSTRQIAAALDLSDSTVRGYISRSLKKLHQNRDTDAECLRDLELEKLDVLERAANRVLAKNHLVVSSGGVVSDTRINPDTGKSEPYKLTDSGPVLKAIGSLLKIAERRARLLGLDAPQKIEQSGGLKVESSYDLSKITDPEELRQLIALLEKAKADEVDDGEE
ncbi:MAG: helix-turn-helix transcriptional regulator [Candidatus Paceibacterota bacterium]|jgi:DNA-binding CsgD family transcriptional regulator